MESLETVSGKTKKKGGLKLPEKAIAALSAWLDANAIPRSSLAQAIGVSQMQAALVMKGKGYLSADHRSRIEEFTKGEITADMLTGSATAPKEFSRPSIATVAADVSGDSDAELSESAAVEEALGVFLTNVRGARTEGERRRSAQALLDYVRGKPRQAEKNNEIEAPIHDAVLLEKLQFIESRLTEDQGGAGSVVLTGGRGGGA